MSLLERPTGGYGNRNDEQRYFAGVSSGDIIEAVSLAYGREVSHTTPDIYYGMAAYAISELRLGPNGMPPRQAASSAFFDTAAIWHQCVEENNEGFAQDESGNIIPYTPNDLWGVEAELLLLTALQGARASGADIAGRAATPDQNFKGADSAYDIALFTLDTNGFTQKTPLQLKAGYINYEVSKKYDPEQVVVVSIKTLSAMLPEEMGAQPTDRLNLTRQWCNYIQQVPEAMAAIQDEPNDRLRAEQLEEIRHDLDRALRHMRQVGETLVRYVQERPDKKIIANLLSQQPAHNQQ
jgi:hypothetical protein